MWLKFLHSFLNNRHLLTGCCTSRNLLPDLKANISCCWGFQGASDVCKSRVCLPWWTQLTRVLWAVTYWPHSSVPHTSRVHVAAHIGNMVLSPHLHRTVGTPCGQLYFQKLLFLVSIFTGLLWGPFKKIQKTIPTPKGIQVQGYMAVLPLSCEGMLSCHCPLWGCAVLLLLSSVRVCCPVTVLCEGALSLSYLLNFYYLQYPTSHTKTDIVIYML